jgi:hypothetical protein
VYVLAKARANLKPRRGYRKLDAPLIHTPTFPDTLGRAIFGALKADIDEN